MPSMSAFGVVKLNKTRMRLMRSHPRLGAIDQVSQLP